MNILEKFHHWRRKQRWNKQYRKGRWESLKSPLEAKRYEQILAYLKAYGPASPHILDIGCGDGVLNFHLKELSVASFTGIDFSSVSIKKAQSQQFKNATFLTRDIITYTPDRPFDVIIFNEAFYYIPESEKMRVLHLMLDHLNEEGLIITSIFREGSGCWEYFKDHPRLDELAFSTVTTVKESTYWKIGAYRKK